MSLPEIGFDLFAFEKLMATFSVWLVICQNSVPAVCTVVSRGLYGPIQVSRLTPKPGVSIPTVTMKFENT